MYNCNMPAYSYFCDANQMLVVVQHDMNVRLKTWGEICYLNQLEPGDTEITAPVRKLITAPNIIINSGNAELRNLGFTKLVKRDEGVYENVTALDHESRYMRAGDKASLPDIKSKVSD